jgi:DNA-binding beta-propeller fold protein YncE
MLPRLAQLLAAAAVIAAGGGACAHGARPAPRASGEGRLPPGAPEVVWPRPPEPPRVRRVASATLARAATGESFWRKALRVVAGVRREETAQDVLVRPFDVAVREDGSFVVADPDRPAVLAYARDGAFVATLGCPGHPWGAPMSVAVARDGAVWVADAADAAVVRWTPQGCTVLRPDGLERPTGIAVAGGTIAVADPPGHRVLLLSGDGAVLARVGARGGGAGEFSFPSDVAAAPDGTLYVVDALNFRVVRLAADGGWLGAFGAPGERGAGLARPKGVDVDAAGRVYVTDAQRDVALVFRPDGSLEYLLGEPGAEPGQLAHPAGISTRGGRLVVADSVNRRAEIFELLGEPR